MSLEVFECIVFVHNHTKSRSKLDPRIIKCVFIIYSSTQKDYKYCEPSSQGFVNLDVTFFENNSYYQKSSPQGENINKDNSFDWYNKNNESPNLNIETEPTTPSYSILPSIDGNLNLRGEIEKQHNKKIITYSWRFKLRNRENFTLEAPKESELVVNPIIHHKSTLNSGNFKSLKSLKLPATLRKQTRSCIFHPINRYVLYETLSSGFRALTTTLNRTKILKNIHKVL